MSSERGKKGNKGDPSGAHVRRTERFYEDSNGFGSQIFGEDASKTFHLKRLEVFTGLETNIGPGHVFEFNGRNRAERGNIVAFDVFILTEVKLESENNEIQRSRLLLARAQLSAVVVSAFVSETTSGLVLRLRRFN